MFWDLVTEGKIRLKNGPFLQNTKLGWIVSGVIHSIPYKQKNKDINCNFLSHSMDLVSLDQLVRNFWEIEELPVPSHKSYSSEETACEEHFIKTTKRLSDRRFCVRFPLKKIA